MQKSILILIFISIWIVSLTLSFITKVRVKLFLSILSDSLFPSVRVTSIYFFLSLLLLGLLNLISLCVFRYPVTTTLAFNLRIALTLWIATIILLVLKKNWTASFLPNNSPWYLIPFLGLVELVSITVRPITLCFRLLANIRAGHILLSLICKLPFFRWLRGMILGVLELMVAMVQSFVFLILIRVYLEERLSH